MPSPDEILDWTPEEMRTWLRSQPPEEDFNWLALGEGAAMAAMSPRNAEPGTRDALGEVAVHAFTMASGRDEGSRAGALLSELALRAGLINRLGVSPGTVRDDKHLLDLISRELEFAEDAKASVSAGPIDLSRTSRSDLRALRRVKNVLRAAELFLTGAADNLPESMSWWWSRRDLLP